MHLGARHNICKTDCSWDKAQWWLGTSSNLYAAFIYLVSSAHDNVADGRDGVRLHCMLEEEEVELFDDESKYLMWTLFFVVLLPMNELKFWFIRKIMIYLRMTNDNYTENKLLLWYKVRLPFMRIHISSYVSNGIELVFRITCSLL